MKIYREDIAGDGRRRILFAVGIDELELLYGVMEKAWIHYPHGPKWYPAGRRMHNIMKGLKKFLDAEKKEDKMRGVQKDKDG